MDTVPVEVTFYTAHEEAPPETEGLFAGLPRTQCMEYVREFELSYDKLFTGDTVTFYGKPYKITSYSLTHVKLGIVVTEDQVLELLVDAKNAGDRFTIKVGGKMDARSLLRGVR